MRCFVNKYCKITGYSSRQIYKATLQNLDEVEMKDAADLRGEEQCAGAEEDGGQPGPGGCGQGGGGGGGQQAEPGQRVQHQVRGDWGGGVRGVVEGEQGVVRPVLGEQRACADRPAAADDLCLVLRVSLDTQQRGVAEAQARKTVQAVFNDCVWVYFLARWGREVERKLRHRY